MSLAWALYSLCLCLLLEAAAGKGKKKPKDDGTKINLAHHSFMVPLQYESMLNDWTVSGASLVETARVLVHPGVAERYAFLFGKQPILSNDFEAIVHFRTVGTKKTEEFSPDQSFGMWYVQENISAGYDELKAKQAKSWQDGLDEMGMKFMGFKSKFKGVGAVLSTADAQKNPKAVVSGIWSDGQTDMVYGKDVPTPTAKAVDFRNTMNPAQFKLRVTPTSVEGYLKQSASLSWNECFKIERNMTAGGYLGFTGWSGTATSGKASDLVAILQLEVNNYDTTSIGEQMHDVSKSIEDAYRDMLTDDKRHFVDQKSQSDHLVRLETMLQNHIDACSTAEKKMFQEMQVLEGRVQGLGEGYSTVVKELQVLVTPQGEVQGAGSDGLQDTIVGLRRVLVKDSAKHKEKTESMLEYISEIKKRHNRVVDSTAFAEVSKSSDNVEVAVVKSSIQRLYMLLTIVACILLIGYLLFNRMQYYERKHFF
jgi:hypothetical protein